MARIVCAPSISPFLRLFSVRFPKKIRDHKLIHQKPPALSWKPIGRDLASALELNDTIGRVFREEQIFRIDHYLGKETVQNLMALRFANALYEPLWNAQYIDHVQISVAESVGLEGRAVTTIRRCAARHGAEPHSAAFLPCGYGSSLLAGFPRLWRDEKLMVLRAAQAINADIVEQMTVRGQYKAGASAGGPVKGYLEELEGGVSNTRNLRRHQGRDQQLALGGWCFLHPHGNADEPHVGNRHYLQADPAQYLRKRCRSVCCKPADIFACSRMKASSNR